MANLESEARTVPPAVCLQPVKGPQPMNRAGHHFSPTAIALGSSAIAKVSGQNCFRTLCGSLGQIRVELPKGSADGSTKSFTKGSNEVHQSFTKVAQAS